MVGSLNLFLINGFFIDQVSLLLRVWLKFLPTCLVVSYTLASIQTDSSKLYAEVIYLPS